MFTDYLDTQSKLSEIVHLMNDLDISHLAQKYQEGHSHTMIRLKLDSHKLAESEVIRLASWEEISFL